MRALIILLGLGGLCHIVLRAYDLHHVAIPRNSGLQRVCKSSLINAEHKFLHFSNCPQGVLIAPRILT